MFALYFFSWKTNILLLDVAGCDITLTVTETKQYVATEGYPNSYKNNQDCNFNFVAAPGRKIIVLFEDFNLQEHEQLEHDDDYDYLSFRKSHNMVSHTHSQIMFS